MPSHDAVVKAVKDICERADSNDVKTLYLAATEGVPDGNLHLAVDQGVRLVYKAHVLYAWRRP
jgi:RNA binding exosome subunit